VVKDHRRTAADCNIDKILARASFSENFLGKITTLPADEIYFDFWIRFSEGMNRLGDASPRLPINRHFAFLLSSGDEFVPSLLWLGEDTGKKNQMD